MRIRRLEAGIAQAETLVKVWLQYRNAFQAARQAGSAEPAEQEEFARITHALLIQYRSCKSLLAKAKLSGHKIIGRSLHSADLERIVEMPEGLFARFEKDWQQGYHILKELVDFLEVYRLALQEMPAWQYGVQVVTDSRYVRIAMLVAALAIGAWTLEKYGALDLAGPAPPSIEVARTVGLVEAMGLDKASWRRLRRGGAVVAGDTIRSGLAAFADIRSDGLTVLRIDPCSMLTIEQSRLAGPSSLRKLELRLLRGRVRVAATAASKGREVRVCTPEAAGRIGSQGAFVSVSHSAKQGSCFAVYQGETELVGPLDRTCLLRAKQRAQVRGDQLSQAPQQLPQDDVAAGMAAARSMQGDTAQLIEIILALARECRDRGRWWESFEAYRQVVTLGPTRALAHVAYQQVGETVGKRYALIEQYRRRADAAPDNPALQYAYGRIVEDPAERKARYLKALAQDEDFYFARVGMADVLVHERRYEDAVAACKRAIALDPSLPHGHHKLAQVYLQIGKRDEAVAQARQVTKDSPHRADAWCELGDLYWRLSMLEQAGQAWLEAIKLDPLHFRAVYSMGLGVPTGARTGSHDAALAWCDQALAIAPGSFEVRARLAHRRGCLWMAGRAKRALAEAEQLVEHWPENYRAYETLAAVYYGIRFEALDYNVKELSLGDLDLPKLCEEALQKAKALEPRAASVRYKLADLYAALRQYDKALAELRQAADLKPWAAEPHARIGDLYQAMDSRYYMGEADAAYQEALTRDPFHAQALQGLTRLCELRGATALVQKRLDQWLQDDPYSTPALSAAYRFYRDVAKDPGRSEKLSQRLERVSPSDAQEAHGAAAGGLRRQLSLAREHKAQRRHKDAEAAYSAAIEMNPYCVSARRELAELQRNAGQLDKARQTLEACAQWSGAASHDLRVASICEGQELYDDAERLAERACAAGVLPAYKWLAGFYARRGKIENDLPTYQARAISALDQLIEQRPQSAAAWLDYGDVMRTRLRDNAQALTAYKTAAELDPNLCAAWRGVGRTAGSSSGEAAEALKRAVDLSPYSGWDRFNYGRQLHRLRRHREAIEQFSKAARTWRNWQPFAYRTMAHQALKDYDGMLESARQMVKEFPALAQSWHWLGKAYDEGLNDHTKAIESYEKALKLGLRNRDGLRAKRRVAELRADAVRVAERKRLAPYLAFLGEVRTAMSKFDADAAVARCDAAVGDPALRAFAKQIEQEKRDVLYARGAWDAAAKAAVGEDRNIRLRGGKVYSGSVAPGPSSLKLIITVAVGKRLLCPLDRIDTSMLVDLARDGLPQDDPLSPVKLALVWYYFGPGHAGQARQELGDVDRALKSSLLEKLAYASMDEAPERRAR